MSSPRVLVIDDSAFARTVLARLMRASGDIEVVGTACDGGEGLQKIGELDPDVVTLDLTMPGVDGLAFLRVLHGRSRPRVIVVSHSTIDTELGVEALALGAIAVISKPALPGTDLNDIRDELVAKVLAAAAYRVPSASGVTGAVPAATSGPVALIMIGASTGGPQALTQLMAALPETLGAPVLIALHIPATYTDAFARRLDRGSPLHVVEADDGMELRPGLAIVARGGRHLVVERDGQLFRTRLAGTPIRHYTPSVDELFASGALAVGAGALGVVLTGMGDDGLAGARAIASAGGALLTESPSTCVVYGMPRCVDEAGLGAISLPLHEIAAEIVRRV